MLVYTITLMEILSIAVGKPQNVSWQGKEVLTSIFKSKAAGPVKLHKDHLEGDEAADKRVHGTIDKAVYAYSLEAYAWWRKNSQFKPQTDVAEFGENLTLSALDEKKMFIGDVYEVGSAHIQVTGPRMPCFKLGIKFGDLEIVKEFLNGSYPGVYFQVVKPGTLSVGDKLKLLRREQSEVSVFELFQIYREKRVSAERALVILSSSQALPASWREKIKKLSAMP